MSSNVTDFKSMLSEIQRTANDSLSGIKARIGHLEAVSSRATGSDPIAHGGDRLTKQLWDATEFEHFRKTGKGRLVLDVPEGFFPSELKTAITSATVGSSTPGILVPDRIPGIAKPGVARIRVRDLMRRFPTTNNAVEFVKENAFTNATSPTAETISKPESALTFTTESAGVKTLAHWLPATRQVLQDFAELRQYVDGRLIEGLMDVEDYELLAGDGTGQHLSGLTVEATAYETGRNQSGDTYIDKTAHAVTQLLESNYFPSGVVLNPRDWFAMQLVKDQASNVGGYVMGGPRRNAEPFLWGLPVATTNALPSGQFLVGDFQQAFIADRMAATVEVSDSHADYFIRNMVAIRAEERIGLVVLKGEAFIFGAF